MASQTQNGGSDSSSFFADILKPGSSLHPTFLLILDLAFTALLFVFAGLAFITNGNFHVFALIAIELGLWASVKWFVHELKRLGPLPDATEASQSGENKKDL
ncbi:hypothetical protein BDN71DRAFT_1587513 [Pleurotus eryngii]|uniref:Uncharacterized protein n=1 Tax=Pleurotus eryngii TaxID=5323 RepID=A0A9P6A7C2_PLEER|nr:hypothetical protein BDN71DRAFT_1587513 [Pleurotus eryngii]